MSYSSLAARSLIERDDFGEWRPDWAGRDLRIDYSIIHHEPMSNRLVRLFDTAGQGFGDDAHGNLTQSRAAMLFADGQHCH
jgi:hypothetical protein